MTRGVPKYRALVAKARNEALQAVGAYNHPLSPFKSGTYVVLMHLAWTALLHAMCWRDGVRPWYRRSGSNRFERIDGRPRTWDLLECVRQFHDQLSEPLRENLRFFVGIRDFVEHADAPEIDLEIFGECQASLSNLDELITREFGASYCLNTTLAFALQFSRIRDPETRQAMRNMLRSPANEDIKAYIDDFRTSLSTDVTGQMEFSHKVFLVPAVGNHRTHDSLAVEWIPYDPADHDEYERTVALIKQRVIPVVNLGALRPKDVVARVADRLDPKVFNRSTHINAWKYFRVRPKPDSSQPERCKSQYCYYDSAHGDYLYTDDWVEFLVRKLSNQSVYEAVVSYRSPQVTNGAEAAR